MRNDLKLFAEAIERNTRFLLVSHIDPDGDAIGSLIALHILLERKGKQAVAFDQDGVPEIYQFLKGADRIRNRIDPSEQFDAVIFLECPNAGRAGDKYSELLKKAPYWINIDHHMDNSGFGSLNIVDPELSAVGMFIYASFKFMDEPVDKASAEALYTAIMTDTGSYRFPNTRPQAHIISAELLALGVDPHRTYQKIYENLSKPAALINARAHGTLEILNGISCITITRKMLEEAGAPPEDTHDIVNYGRNIRDVEVALLFREVENGVKVSLRSKSFLNVNQIATRFGGGGHLQASGCTIQADMEQAKRLIFSEVRQALKAAGEPVHPA
jgi:phosphoesterase RecJ-like protein